MAAHRPAAKARVGAGIDLALEHGDDQVRALGEVPLERADADAGKCGDLLRGRGDAGRPEGGLCRFEQSGGVALCVDTLSALSLGRVLRHSIQVLCYPE
jgi:hypothetical protein